MDDRALNLLGALADALHDEMTLAAEQLGNLGASAPAALATLYACPGESLEWLSKVLGITNSGVVRLVDKLVDAGLAVRRPGADGRTKSLHLTARGARLATRITARRRDALARAVAGLGREQQAALAESVESMLIGLSTDRITVDRICRLCDYVACPQDRCPAELAVT
jgi:DNA-binding MarR family transcriptional regulator